MWITVAGQALRSVLLLLIVALASGCDNVEWEGTEFRLEPPPPKVSEAVDSGATALADTAAPPPPPLPEHPVLFMGSRSGSRVTLTPVAELTPDGPAALPTEAEAPGFGAHWAEMRLSPGTELTLFAAGTRVGTLLIDEVTGAGDWCRDLPAVSGTPELTPPASGARRFLALSGTGEMRFDHGPYRASETSAEQRAAGTSLANNAIARASAPWPPSVVGIRRDIQALHLHPDSAPMVAGTFAYQDDVVVGQPEGANAYSFLILGEPGPSRYDLVYYRYRSADDEKSVPRYFQHGDWDFDGESEILVELFGTEGRTALLLDRDGEGWRESFELPCTAPTDG